MASNNSYSIEGWAEDENYISVDESLKRIAKYNETLVKENAQKELKACAEILKEMK